MKYIYIPLILVLFSCGKEKKCACEEEYDPILTYVYKNSVIYQGKCYTALTQGRGTAPGNLTPSGETLWEECNKD